MITKIDKDGIMAHFFQNLYRAEETEKQKEEERERKHQEKIQKTAAKLDPVAQKLYLFLKSGATSFWGDSGPANLSFDREEWRKFDAWLKELEK